MGVHNRQRRAEKRRKRAKSQSGGAAGPRMDWHDDAPGGGYGGDAEARALAASLVLQAIAEVEIDPAAAARYAAAFSRQDGVVAPKHVARAVDTLLTTQLGQVLRGGWAPSDLAEIVGRRLTAHHLSPLAALLVAEADRHPADRVATAWRDDLSGLGPAEPADLTTAADMELALELAALFGRLPTITAVLPPPGTPAEPGRRAGTQDVKRLATVRALLAKAESTQYDEEAEALSAKAQELISRYALDRLIDEPEQVRAGAPVSARRLWIEAPYVFAKAMLVGAVARANRCRSVVSEQLGFSTVVGEPSDLEAVELLATSLLVQANTAMLRCGRHADRSGTSRTRSFRQSFLVAYATRIGERLSAATADAVVQTGRSGELVPVLRRQEERVTEAFSEMFPRTVSRETQITNGQGWAAGRAAADLALFDTRQPLAEAAC